MMGIKSQKSKFKSQKRVSYGVCFFSFFDLSFYFQQPLLVFQPRSKGGPAVECTSIVENTAKTKSPAPKVFTF